MGADKRVCRVFLIRALRGPTSFHDIMHDGRRSSHSNFSTTTFFSVVLFFMEGAYIALHQSDQGVIPGGQTAYRSDGLHMVTETKETGKWHG